MRKIVVLEGINGCGKSTAIKGLVEAYPDAIVTSHPGSTDIGKELRKLLKFGNFNLSASQELALFAADAIGFYNQFVEVDDDKLLICDRLNITSAVYQRAKGVTLDEMRAMYDLLIACGWKQKINKLLVFTAPFEVIQSRIKKPTLVDQDKVQGDRKDRFESAGDDYLRKVHNYYDTIDKDFEFKFILKKFVDGQDIHMINVDRDISSVIGDVKNYIDKI